MVQGTPILRNHQFCGFNHDRYQSGISFRGRFCSTWRPGHVLEENLWVRNQMFLQAVSWLRVASHWRGTVEARDSIGLDILSWECHERYIQQLTSHLQVEPPPNYSQPTLPQLLKADRQVFLYLICVGVRPSYRFASGMS